jgi:glutaredoxin
VISPPRVQLYSAPFCAYGDRARAPLERRPIAFEEIDLSRDL